MPDPAVPLTVAVDATPLLGTRTGIGVTVAGMIAAVAGRPGLDLVGFGMTARGWRQLPGALPAGVRPARSLPMPAAILLRLWARLDQPSVQAWTGPVDVVHGTNFVVPPAGRAGRVVTVNDLTAVRYPDLCAPTSLRYPGLIARAISQGAWVHTSTSTMAEECMDHFGVAQDRVRVVPFGVDVRTAEQPARFERPYILALGTTEPRKDFPGLVAAFTALAGDHPHLDLRLAGPEGWAEAEVAAVVASSPHAARIHRMGWVEDMGALMAGAEVLAYPSVYEGFGLPPLEAMAAGVPVVATTAGSLPEVLGDAAVLVPPRDPDALAAALASVLDDPTRRDQLVAAGRQRAAAYPWTATGDGLAALYRDVATA